MEKLTFTAIDYNSLENKVIEGLVRDNYSKIKNTFYRVFDKRILKCQEGNRVWYQLWITDLDMAMLEKYYLDLIEKKLIKSWWLRNLQVWYVFFYEKKGRKSNLVVGKETAQYILNCVE